MEMTTAVYKTALRMQIPFSKVVVDVMDSPFLSTL